MSRLLRGLLTAGLLGGAFAGPALAEPDATVAPAPAAKPTPLTYTAGSQQNAAATPGAKPAATAPAQSQRDTTPSPAAKPEPISLARPGEQNTPPAPAAKPADAAINPSSLAISPGAQDAGTEPSGKQATRRRARPATALTRGVAVVTAQHASWGRITFVLHGNPAPEVRPVPGGLEVHFAAGLHVGISPAAQLHETGPISLQDDGGSSIAVIHFTCSCVPEQVNETGVLRLDIRPDAAAAKPAAEAKTAPIEAGAKPDPGATTESAAKVKPATEAKTGPGAKPGEAEEMARLRAFLTEKLARLNGAAPPAQPALISDAAASRPSRTPPSAPANSGAQTVAEAPAGPQFCLAPVNASDWAGSGPFTDRLVALRTQTARSRSAVEDIATLAEFYLANGLGHEALAAATEALEADATPDTRLRLTRDADIARLVKGEPLSPDSPLLSNPANCARSDAPLWRDLAAAAGGDAEGATRDPEIVAAALHRMPEPLQHELAFRIVSAVGDNLDMLRAMAGAMRNATTEIPEDEARRFLLQARIAGLTGDRSEYAAFLERAARFDMTVPGVIAKAWLAAVRAAAGGSGAAHSEAMLIDIARTYRHEALGQQAAEQYAELLLQRHDYAAALAIADESVGPRGPQPRESRGASLVLRILRMLFVDPATAALPEPAERIALYLRYGGYTTPGEKGDDIRLAAARLMLARNMPDAALEPLRQLSETSAATPEASQMLATAEALGGDPAKAMELVKALPDDIAAHRIAAEALHRMRQPLDAAHALDGATSITDRERRASLLFEGEAWKDAADTYADLLRDSLLPTAIRNDLATRYALSMAMSGQPVNETPVKLPAGPTALLAAIPSSASAGPNGAPPSLTVLRGALERARHIETMLDPPAAHQGS